MKTPEWIKNASREELVKLAEKLADALDDLHLDAVEIHECFKQGCAECRSDFTACNVLKAVRALNEWCDGPGTEV